MTAEPGVDEAGRRVREQAESTEGRLALQATGDVIGQRDDLVGRGEGELARVQDERLAALGHDLTREVDLLLGGVDVGVAVVLEHPEVLVDADVDAGRLDHLVVVRL